jgi:hypothetical protein
MDDLRYKRCPGCQKHRPIDDFRDKDTGLGRFYKYCRECGGSVVPVYPDEKECPVCGEVRPLADFKRTPGRGRSSKICNFCHEAVEAEKEERRKEREHRKEEKKAALEKWKKERAKRSTKKGGGDGQVCPVCGEFKPYDKYHRQGVTQVTKDTPCNNCIGTEAYEAWYGEWVREYNRKKQQEYRKKKRKNLLTLD